MKNYETFEQFMVIILLISAIFFCAHLEYLVRTDIKIEREEAHQEGYKAGIVKTVIWLKDGGHKSYIGTLRIDAPYTIVENIRFLAVNTEYAICINKNNHHNMIKNCIIKTIK